LAGPAIRAAAKAMPIRVFLFICLSLRGRGWPPRRRPDA
jgi:hypothetical protein